MTQTVKQPDAKVAKKREGRKETAALSVVWLFAAIVALLGDLCVRLLAV